MTNWKISQKQKKILDNLFREIDISKVARVLNVGSSRTSIAYLTDKFKNVKIEGIVYPGDQRKIEPIKEYVEAENYELIETDIKDFDLRQEFDVVLAHLFLGEAKKFGNNNFSSVLNSLFAIKTRYLIVVNLFRDDIDYGSLLKLIAQKGKILSLAYEVSENGDECLGFCMEKTT